jgi:hypothetical protein
VTDDPIARLHANLAADTARLTAVRTVDPRLLDTGELVRRAAHKFRARRGERIVFAGGRRVVVHTPGAMLLHLPNGTAVEVRTDDSGVATQIEESERLHAIARPRTIHRTRRIN